MLAKTQGGHLQTEKKLKEATAIVDVVKVAAVADNAKAKETHRLQATAL